jgi:N-methylhydantoinase A
VSQEFAEPRPTRWLGIDVGGTFTDLVLYDEASGAIVLTKTPSTPHDHSEAMLAGIHRLGVDLAEVAKLAHGTTIATNTVLERTGARTAVLTTRGFRDVLEVGRGNRVVLYNIKATRPRPLVPRSLRFEVDERTLFDGTILREVERGAIDAVIAELRARGVEAVAVCYLHSYANPSNERQTKEWLEKSAPDLFVSVSSGVLPEYREFERFATTMLNAYVAPRVGRYLGALREKLVAGGYQKAVTIMTSNGGAMPLDTLVELPAHSMLSGPAAGVIAAAHVGRSAGHRDLITYDMGGTSTDVCLVKDGALPMTTDGAIGTLPLRILQIDINSIGAGGGSIAWLGAGKFLNVGPQSAGAVPGPAAYGRGGNAPTVTDANVVLGRLGTDRALGGEIRLDAIAAEEAVGCLGRELGVSLVAMADGIVKLAVARMTGAIKEISIMRGQDPRAFALFAYGGAGPMHAALIAAELGIPRVVVPPLPGNFSAFGLLVADVRHDLVRTRIVPTRDIGWPELQDVFTELRDEGQRRLLRDGFAEPAMRFEAALDMRYVGQAFELSVPFDGGLVSMADVDRAFYAAHERRYAHAVPDPVEIVSFRLSAWGAVAKPRLPGTARLATSLDAARSGERPVAFDGCFIATPIYQRERLPRDVVVAGPAVIEEAGATTIVPPGFDARSDAWDNLVLERTQPS